MLHPVRVPPASGSLPPWMFPRGIPSAALHTKQQVPVGGRSRASPIHGSLSLASSARNMPPASRAAVPAYPRFRSAPPPPASPPPPTTKDAPRPASGIVLRPPLTVSFLVANLSHLTITGVRHTMPPSPQDSRLDASGNALRRMRRCRRSFPLALPSPGAMASSVVLAAACAASSLHSSLPRLHCGNA